MVKAARTGKNYLSYRRGAKRAVIAVVKPTGAFGISRVVAHVVYKYENAFFRFGVCGLIRRGISVSHSARNGVLPFCKLPDDSRVAHLFDVKTRTYYLHGLKRIVYLFIIKPERMKNGDDSAAVIDIDYIVVDYLLFFINAVMGDRKRAFFAVYCRHVIIGFRRSKAAGGTMMSSDMIVSDIFRF